MHMYTQIILINHLLHQIIFEIFFTFKPRYTLREIRYPRISEIACLLLIGRRRITLDFENWKPRESMRFRFKAKKALGIYAIQRTPSDQPKPQTKYSSSHLASTHDRDDLAWA